MSRFVAALSAVRSGALRRHWFSVMQCLSYMKVPSMTTSIDNYAYFLDLRLLKNFLAGSLKRCISSHRRARVPAVWFIFFFSIFGVVADSTETSICSLLSEAFTSRLPPGQ